MTVLVRFFFFSLSFVLKYWNIVSMENLLAQLVEDSAPVARRLVSLLFNSLQPLDRAGEVQIERCIALIQTNPAASRVFYQYAHRHMSVTTAGRLLSEWCFASSVVIKTFSWTFSVHQSIQVILKKLSPVTHTVLSILWVQYEQFDI